VQGDWQSAPVQTFQPQFQGGFQSQTWQPAPQQFVSAPRQQRSSFGFGGDDYGYDDGQSQDDSMKKVVLLSSLSSGQVNPMTAVALDRNKGMSAADTALVSSMGNGVSTALALTGGFGGSGSQGGLFGNSGGGGLFGNSGGGSSSLLKTVVVAQALAPKTDSKSKTSSSAASNLATFALLSNMQGNNQNNGGF